MHTVTIEIITNTGPVTVQAWKHPSADGLAVVMYPFGEFSVTHIPSTRSFFGGFERFAEALIPLAKLQLIANDNSFSWADLKNQAEVTELLGKINDRPIPDLQEENHPIPTIGGWLSQYQQIQCIRDLCGYPCDDKHPLDQALELLPMPETDEEECELTNDASEKLNNE